MNPYADIQISEPGFVVEVQHGSGPGRSSGVASVIKVEDGDWFNNDQTTTYYGPFATEEEATLFGSEKDDYYDGSDYA